MTAQEVFQQTVNPTKIAIIYKTKNWGDSMYKELTAFAGEDITESRDDFIEINFTKRYSFIDFNQFRGEKYDYIIAECGLPHYALQPCLISHFFHDHKTPTIDEDDY